MRTSCIVFIVHEHVRDPATCRNEVQGEQENLPRSRYFPKGVVGLVSLHRGDLVSWIAGHEGFNQRPSPSWPADTARLQERLSTELTGTRVRGTAIEVLCKNIVESADPVTEWTEIARELESLDIIEADEDDDVTVPGCPRLVKAGVTQNDLERIARKLKPTTWLELSLTQLDDVPEFEYQRRENDYIAFASASAGQQATALLQVLLNQDGPPLVIDQPEDDLDNQVIFDIVEQLWSARSRRQIIVSSHNANLVVNGDADLVVCCDYRRSGDHSGGQMKCRGAIDIEQIREEIKRVMEGGERAFQLRRAKYGF